MAIKILKGAESVFEGPSKLLNHNMKSLGLGQLCQTAYETSLKRKSPYLYQRQTAD